MKCEPIILLYWANAYINVYMHELLPMLPGNHCDVLNLPVWLMNRSSHANIT